MPNKTKTYVNGCFARKFEFNNGGSILKLSMKVQEVIEFLNEHQNEKGWCNIVVAEKREPDKNGNTHNAYLDDWNPKVHPSNAKTTRHEPTQKSDEPEDDLDMSVPF